MHTIWCNRLPALFRLAASRSRLDAVTRAATAAPTGRVDTKRTPGAWPMARRDPPRADQRQTAIDSTSLGGRPCLRLVKHALLIYLGRVAREQENATCREPSIGTSIGGDRLPHLYVVGPAGSSTTHSIPPASGWSRRSKTNWHPTRSARAQFVFHFLTRSRPN